MKNLAFAAFAALFLLGCGGKELSPLESRIAEKMSFVDVDKSIVKAFNYRTNSNGLLEFELVLLSDDDAQLEYRVSWKDEDGFTIKAPTDGEFIGIKLKENKEFLLQRVATNKAAVDFSLILREK
jgi:uncharacterized protein YcfL